MIFFSLKMEGRTILLAGRTNTGKTTFVENVVNGSTNVEVERSMIFSDTKDNSKFEFENYTFVDQPGLFDVSRRNEYSPSNDEIIENTLEFCTPDVILFTMSIESGVNSQDIESIKLWKERFPETPAAIIITRFDNLTHRRMEKRRAELNRYFKNVGIDKLFPDVNDGDKTNKPYYFSGLANHSMYVGPILAERQKIFDFINSCE